MQSNPILGSIFMYGAIFAIFYFILIRPQSVQRKKHDELVRALKKGDEIVTNGGLVGEVLFIKEMGDDKSAGLEDLQSARSLADEVRRRLQTAPPANSARCEEPDLVLAEEPAGGLGGIARLGVVREDHDERTAALEEDRREEKRQEGLGDAGGRGRRDELAKALALGELAGEGVEDRLVHDE